MTVPVETTAITPRMLRERMAAKGVRMDDVAREADMPAPTLSSILRGKDTCGKIRRDRIEQAIIALGLDKEPEPEENPPVVFYVRIRSLGEGS